MIYTVTGPIKKSEMGRTLGHEHFNWIDDNTFASSMYFEKIYDDLYNQKMFHKLMPILKGLKAANCQSIVEASPPLGGQNLKLLYEFSKATDINIIPCTGISVPKNAFEIFRDGFVDQLAQRWVSDFEVGLDTIDGICIKPAYIKLLLDRGPLSAVDEGMVKAAALASNKTGMPIQCHILEAKHVKGVLKILEAMNVPPSKFLWAHADYEGKIDIILEVVKRGYWLGFDMIREASYENRKYLINHALTHGYADKILLSQDYDFYEEYENIDSVNRCRSFFTEFIPYCVQRGISEILLEKIITENPSNFYDI